MINVFFVLKDVVLVDLMMDIYMYYVNVLWRKKFELCCQRWILCESTLSLLCEQRVKCPTYTSSFLHNVLRFKS